MGMSLRAIYRHVVQKRCLLKKWVSHIKFGAYSTVFTRFRYDFECIFGFRGGKPGFIKDVVKSATF